MYNFPNLTDIQERIRAEYEIKEGGYYDAAAVLEHNRDHLSAPQLIQNGETEMQNCRLVLIGLNRKQTELAKLHESPKFW